MKVLTFQKCHRAQLYMLAHKALEDFYDIDEEKTESKPIIPSNAKYNHILIEKCVNLFRKRRPHHNVMDFDKKVSQ